MARRGGLTASAEAAASCGATAICRAAASCRAAATWDPAMGVLMGVPAHGEGAATMSLWFEASILPLMRSKGLGLSSTSSPIQVTKLKAAAKVGQVEVRGAKVDDPCVDPRSGTKAATNDACADVAAKARMDDMLGSEYVVNKDMETQEQWVWLQCVRMATKFAIFECIMQCAFLDMYSFSKGPNCRPFVQFNCCNLSIRISQLKTTSTWSAYTSISSSARSNQSSTAWIRRRCKF